MNRKKGGHREIPTVTTLSPEECVQQLQKLGEYGIRVVVKRENEDLYLFDAEQWENNQVTARAEGQLKRWEGTSTHMKVDQKLSERQQQRVNRLRWQIPVLALVVALVVSLSLMLDLRSTFLLMSVALLMGLIPGPVLKRFWMSRESDDMLWIIGSALRGRSLEPVPLVRSVEEIGLDDELQSRTVSGKG